MLQWQTELLQYDLEKIPFPAFTICDTGRRTYATSDIEVQWMDYFSLPVFMASTELGKCKTLNFCDQKMFFRDEVFKGDRAFRLLVSKYEDDVPLNQTQPVMTTSSELGIEAVISRHQYNMETLKYSDSNSFILMIHSPFEVPTKANQKFYLTDLDSDLFSVTPQVNTIDDTMTGMKPHE